MGSARPVRRSFALRVLTDRASRTTEAVRGPPCAFALLQRTIAATPHRATSHEGPRTMLPLLSFSALRHDLGTADPFRGRRVPAPSRATSGVWLPPSRRPPPS